jgi:hypothetical protein
MDGIVVHVLFSVTFDYLITMKWKLTKNNQQYMTRRQKVGFNFGTGTYCSINQQSATIYCADRMSAPNF